MEDKKVRLNADEIHALLHLCAAVQALKKAEPLQDRIKSLDSGKTMFSGARGMLQKLARNIFKSMPPEQYASFDRNLAGMRYTVKVQNVGGMSVKDDGRWLSIEALELICDATKDHCLVCSKDVQQQRSCKLAKALDELPCAKADEKARGCRYYGGI